ncbi:OLC1v1021371C1 [Oldenlandia corymbosa var. corymbosa]|uniref:OLC1v1021371C1 n=1 Tax=Oldenlandia corymbosa var. corymbosa TaxID=529605 RepID=A0AAV1BX01_OLDCO|nr:OLC1v1021371C1 [Oldenlandia corymbosa var. corymbosa]
MRPKIYLFGDSITEQSFEDGGWGASLANHFSRTADVAIRGYSGYNTRWALMVLDKVFPAPLPGQNGGGEAEPVCVTVFFGANDACLPDRYARAQHVPLDEYKHNLRSIVCFLKVITINKLDY